MADVDGKQLMVDVENADSVGNDVGLAVNTSFENRVSDETIDTANENVAAAVSQGVDVLTEAVDKSCERIGNDGQSNSSDVANTVKLKSQRRKRTGVRELLAPADTETPAKRRRVQHNYRRLSSAGYVDDYDGRERFSAKQATASSGNRLSPSKTKNADSLREPVSRHSASKTTRSRSELDTLRGQSVFEHFIFKDICCLSITAN